MCRGGQEITLVIDLVLQEISRRKKYQYWGRGWGWGEAL